MSDAPRGRGTGRASGKVILLGEHAVVYGAPALAAGIDRGAKAEATLVGAGEPSAIEMLGERVVAGAPGDDRARALAALLAEGSPLPPMTIAAMSDLPPAAGLGSSAAIGIAAARAAMEAAGLAPSDEAAIARTLILCIGMSGAVASTKVMVEGVARLRERKREMVDRSIAGITALVENARLAIEAGDLSGLGRLMDLNQMLLAGLMLSTEALEELCKVARDSGALGAKLTGKGGGGAAIALAPDDDGATRILAAWRAAGYEGFTTKVTTRTS